MKTLPSSGTHAKFTASFHRRIDELLALGWHPGGARLGPRRSRRKKFSPLPFVTVMEADV